MRDFATRTYPWAAPLFVGAAFVATTVVAKDAPDAATYAIPALGAAATAAAAIATYGLARIGHGRRVAALTAATTAVLVAGAIGCLLIVETSLGRVALALTTVVLVAVYLAYLRGMVRGDERFRSEDFSHLSFAVHVISVFFAFALAFGIPNYLQVSVPAAAAAVAVCILVATAETIRRAGLAGREAMALSGALVALGVQLFVALTFLPTTYLVNATVGTLLYAAALHAAVAILGGKAPSRVFRSQFAMTLLLVIVVLSTARWA